MTGQTISFYRILNELGRGGMGVVYEAEDTRLGRRVAIKFLPAEMAANPQLLERFRQEARSASALNHPGICTIHDVGEFEGHHYIVMEKLEGQPLDRRLATGPLPLTQILDYGVQIADALDAAQTHGIVHRDIKPANIFLTSRDQVKVLDFGLAKLSTDRRISPQAVTGSGSVPTSDGMLTNPGMSVGTIIYMSPEQARGEPLDSRTDLFSFGAVLYQMSAGNLAFDGATTAVMFDAILNRTPLPPRQFRPELPEKLEEIIFKALEKDRDLRYQTAAEMRGDLKRLRRDLSVGSGSGSHPASGSSAGQPAPPSGVVTSGDALPTPPSGASNLSSTAEVARPQISSSTMITSESPVHVVRPDAHASSAQVLRAAAAEHKTGWGVTLLVIIAVIAAVSIGVYRFVTTRSGGGINTQTMTVKPLTSSGDVMFAAMSADGRYLAFVQRKEQRSLWVRQLATGSLVQVVAPAPGIYDNLTFSPDGNYIFYPHTPDPNSSAYSLYSVASLGGTPGRVVSDVASGVSFSPDGKRITFLRVSPDGSHGELITANMDGTGEKVLLSRPSSLSFQTGTPSWSPDGKSIAAVAVHQIQGALCEIVVVPAEGGTPQTLLTPMLIRSVAWTADGKGLLVVSGDRSTAFRQQIFYQPWPSGEMTKVSNDLANYPTGISLSTDGKSLVTTQEQFRITFLIGAASNPDELKPFPTSDSSGLSVTWADADHLVVHDQALHMFAVKTDGTEQKVLVNPDTISENPSVCGDGKTVIFDVLNKNGELNVFRIDMNGENLTELTHGKLDQAPSCSPDSKTVIYQGEGAGKIQIWKVPVAGGEPALATDVQGFGPEYSVDGKYILATSAEGSGADQTKVVRIVDAQSGKLTQTVKFDVFANNFHWTPDGKAISYVYQPGSVSNLWVRPLDGTAARQLTHYTSDGIGSYSWSKDGKQLALSRTHGSRDAVMFSSLK